MFWYYRPATAGVSAQQQFETEYAAPILETVPCTVFIVQTPKGIIPHQAGADTAGLPPNCSAFLNEYLARA